MTLLGTLCMQIEYECDGQINTAVGKPSEIHKLLDINKIKIRRVLLRERTKEDENYANMWIKQDMLGYYLLQDLDEDPFTSNPN